MCIGVRFVLWVWHFKNCLTLVFWQFVYTCLHILFCSFRGLFVHLRVGTNSDWLFLSIIAVGLLVRLIFFSSGCQSSVFSLPILKKVWLDKREEKFNENKFKFIWWLRKVNESVKKFWRVYEIGELTVFEELKKFQKVRFCGNFILWRRLTEFKF